jgi:diacylglycerol kinase (ATP)
MTGGSQRPLGAPLLICNPSAGTGDARIVDRLVAALRDHGVEPDVVRTTGAGDAEVIARQAAEAGRRLVVAVGGDGTVHDVVNGLVDAETGLVRGDDPVLGVVGAGSGCDLMRTFGLDRVPEVLARHLVTDDTLAFDLGRARTTQADSSTRTRLFANVAEVGYGGTVTHVANRLPRRVGRARYAAAIVASVPGFRRVSTTVTVDGGSVTERLCNVVIANGQFFGGGLKVAPRALPTDGRFNVQSWGGRPIDVLLAQPQLRRGEHLRRDDVREWQSAHVSVDAESPLRVEADGEVLGRTPASFDVLPGALKLKL